MPQPMKELYEFDSFTLDVSEGRLLRDGQVIPVKPKVLETLVVLIENAGHAMGKEELMNRLWPDVAVEEANLAVNISQLRKALGDHENGEQLIETVPKRGYRFNARVSKVLANRVDMIVRERTRARIVVHEHEDETDEKLAAGNHAPVEITSRPALPVATAKPLTWLNRHKRLSVAIAVVIGIGGIAYFVRLRNGRSPAAPLRVHNLAILPFRNLRPNSETDFLGVSVTDAIITRLGHIRMLVVRPSSYVAKYRNQDIDPRTVAQELNVDTMLLGSFQKDGDDLRITAQLIDVSTSEMLWRDTIDVKYEKLLSVEDRVSEEIINGLQLKLSPAETEALIADAPQNPVAYEKYLRGRYLISTKDHPVAIKLLEDSVAHDPKFAVAWAYLGKAYSITASQYFGGREFHDKAQAAYDRALALNPRQIETRVLLANFLTENNRVEEAVPTLREVIAENPNHPFARWELSYAYRYAGMLDESIIQGESALQIQANLTGHLFNSYLYAGRYQEFVNSLPMRDDAYVDFYRGLGSYYLKDWTRAVLHFERASQLDSTAVVSQIGKALTLGMAGRNREGIEVLKAVEGKLEKDPFGDGEICYKLAQAYAVLGEKQSALRNLRNSIERGFFCHAYFISDPLIENLRSENEYSSLIESARLRHEEFKRRFF